MKNILLIGDSIRAGYDSYVKESFEGIANVYYPGENCRFAQNVLRSLHEWIEDTDQDRIDIIHWNAGLWDTLRLFGDDPLTPPEMYGEMIRRVDKRLRFLFPNAKMVFATSTRNRGKPAVAVRRNHTVITPRAMVKVSIKIASPNTISLLLKPTAAPRPNSAR